MSDWQPIEAAPRDATVLVSVEPTEANSTFFGKRGPAVHPAYIDEEGRICDSSTWAADKGLNGPMWRATHWMPLPAPPTAQPKEINP